MSSYDQTFLDLKVYMLHFSNQTYSLVFLKTFLALNYYDHVATQRGKAQLLCLENLEEFRMWLGLVQE